MLRKIYNFYPVTPEPDPNNLPVGGDIYYECKECKGIVNSVSRIKASCECGNLTADKGVCQIKDRNKVTAVKGKLK